MKCTIAIPVMTAVWIACLQAPAAAGDANAPRSRTVQVPRHPYALTLPADFAEPSTPADGNMLLIARDPNARATVRVWSGGNDPRATVLTVHKAYEADLARRMPSAKKQKTSWVTIASTNALVRRYTTAVDGNDVDLQALVFVSGRTSLVVETVAPPESRAAMERVLLSLQKGYATALPQLPIGETGYRIAPPKGWKVTRGKTGNLRLAAPGGKALLDVYVLRVKDDRKPADLAATLAEAFGKEMSKAEGKWKLAARESIDRDALQGRMQYFLGAPGGVQSDLVVLHAAGEDYMFTLTAALPAVVRDRFAKQLVRCMMSLSRADRSPTRGTSVR
ncbi:MAG: hypothetical protein ACLFV7_00505 [Phycisphaerae bacterium]